MSGRETSSWQTIAGAPFDEDVELAVIDGSEIAALIFPCRQGSGGWTNALTGDLLYVTPTHWRAWKRLR